MFLELGHTKLDAYKTAIELVQTCYALTSQFPVEEKFGLSSQIRKAAISVVLNLAEGRSRITKAERKRFVEIARSSVVEVDAAFGIAIKLGYMKISDGSSIRELINKAFAQLSGLLRT